MDEGRTLDVRERIRGWGVVPVVAIARAEDGPRLGAALVDGGLPCAEITLRTAAGLEAIMSMRSARPEMLVGAGTVLSVDQAAQAIDAGAQFVVSPGFSDTVVALCIARGIPVFPGVVTPTEVMRALDAGVTDLKFFPAGSAGGLAHLRALAGPFPSVRFIPTGGIGLADIPAYLGLSSVLAVGGSWMVSKDLLAAGDWAAVASAAAEAVTAVQATRAPGTSARTP
jgi:2-dehydro-3-deoxyphosphogluconate aldolase/(4S)-4-hydroxy-2-oxoglutarate aldolase